MYIYIYTYSYLINCEYFNNLNENVDMAGTGIIAGTSIIAGICPSPYPTEKVMDSPYPINVGIPRQNGDGFGQYPRGRVYLPSLVPRRGGSAGVTSVRAG